MMKLLMDRHYQKLLLLTGLKALFVQKLDQYKRFQIRVTEFVTELNEIAKQLDIDSHELIIALRKIG